MEIKFDPYVDYNSFPRYGSSRVTRAWSLDFLRRDVTAPGSRETMDQHRPIYDPPRVSTTIIAAEEADYIKVLQDWPAWIEQGLLDEFYIWFRTDSDLKALERPVRLAVDVAAGRVPVIAELSYYHPGSFQDPDLIVSAGRIAVDNGASGVGIYRSHAVEQLDFWPVLEELGKI